MCILIRSNQFILYSLQLAKVYCVGIFFAVCYILDSAIIIEGNMIDSNVATGEADLSAAYTGDGFHTLQGSIHRQAVFVNYQVLLAIFQLNINLLIGDGNTITCAQCCVRNLVLHILYVGYRFILVCINLSYICIVGSYAVYSQVFLQCQTSFGNLKVIFAILQLHRNCIIFSANGNTIACCISGVFCIYSVDVLSICSRSFFYRSDVGTCFYLCFSCCA